MGFEKGKLSISMNETRGARLHDAVCEALNANETLRTIAKQFPADAISPGEVQPSIVVEALTHALDLRLGLALALLNNEEQGIAKYRSLCTRGDSDEENA